MDSANICATCQNLAPTIDDTFGTGKVISGIPFIALQSSAQRGCVLCKVICQSISATGADKFSEAIQSVDIRARIAQPIELVAWIGKKPVGEIHIALSGTEQNNGNLPQFGISRVVEAEPYNPFGQALLKYWIQDCLENHVSCKLGISGLSTEMPTRLLDIMPDENDVELRLIRTSSLPVRYAALSHCWGRSQNTKTTSENIHSMLRNIPLSSLPKTFRDAVNLCRELNIRYLWIDSLCIVQDDTAEWRYEASRMTMVYSGAFIVLAASASADDKIGMFPLRRNQFCEEFSFKWNGHAVRLIAQPSRDHYDHLFHGEGPLALRAWAYQERLLGRRVLLYHKDELFWECNQIWRCECGVGDKIGHRRYRYNLKEIFDMGREDSTILYQEWRHVIVRAFSCRNLSRASDKLPAISGVAEAFRSRLNDEYLAGIWRKDLVRGLLWLNSVKLQYCSLIEEYRAPSWSWVSVNCGAFSDDISNERIYVEILDVCCKLAGRELTGEVVDGWITISGPLNRAWVMLPPAGLEPHLELPLFVGTDQLEFVSGFRVDCLLGVGFAQTDEGVTENTAIRSHKISDPDSIWHWRSDLSKLPLSDHHVSVWCLKIAQVVINDEWKDQVLVLGRSQRRKGSFERLGLATLPAEKSEATLFKDAVDTTITIV